MQTNILQLLRSDGSITVNKTLAHNIGLEEAIIYSELASLYLYYDSIGKLVRLPLSKDRGTGETTYSIEKFFYCTSEKLEENTTLSKKVQLRCIKKLISLGLICQKNKKLDNSTSQTRYFTINMDIDLILSFLGRKRESSLESLDTHGKFQNVTFESAKKELSKVPKGNGSNTNITNTKENKTTGKEPAAATTYLIEKETSLILTEYQKKITSKWDIETTKRAIAIFKQEEGQYFKFLNSIYKTGATQKIKTGVSSKIKAYNAMEEHERDYDSMEELEALRQQLELGKITQEEYEERADRFREEAGI